jgi:hypothetical protein
LNFNNRFRTAELGDRAPISEPLLTKRLDFPLQIAAPYVDLLCELPQFRDLSHAQLLKLLPKRYHQCVPTIGADLEIREAAYQRETRMARAVIIGLLAKEDHIAVFSSQRFLERL